MSRYVALLLLLSALLFGAAEGFGLTHRFRLAKDQLAVIEIKKSSPVTFAKEGDLRFRWTLWKNRMLVLLLEYEGFRYQYLLEPKFGHNTIKLFLIGVYKRIDRRPFLLLTFERFDEKARRAELAAQFYDPDKGMEIKIKKPKK